MQDEILQALETLVQNNCLTVSDALDKAYLAGHRKAVKELDKTNLVLGGGYSGSTNVTIASTTGYSPKQ